MLPICCLIIVHLSTLPLFRTRQRTNFRFSYYAERQVKATSIGLLYNALYWNRKTLHLQSDPTPTFFLKRKSKRSTQ